MIMAGFIQPSDNRWNKVLAKLTHDFYHLPEYLKFAAKYEGGTPVAFYAQEGNAVFLAPLLVREIPQSLGVPRGWYDATTPYGYPTPITNTANPNNLSHFIKQFKKSALREKIICSFFRLHPLLPLMKEELNKNGSLVRHGKTVYVDLSLPVKELWSQTRPNHKSGINKLIRSGFEVKMNDWNFYDFFINIYNDTMKRLSAREFYFFSKDYFYELRSILAQNLHLCTVLSPEGEVAAAGLFTAKCGIVEYHLGGTNSKYLKQAPSKLMFHFVREWAKERGHKYLHLGGGVGGKEDSLFHFKAGFSKLKADFYTYRMIIDKEKYDLLVNTWKEKYKVTDYDEQFFPLYRYPAP